MDCISIYNDMVSYLSKDYKEVKGKDFYNDLFPDNQNEGEYNDDYSKPNAIYLYRDPEDEGTKRKLRRRIMLNDTWSDDYDKFIKDNPMTLCSGLTYRGRTNELVNAQSMNALIFDLDSVSVQELNILMKRLDKDPKIPRSLPRPTYVVLSGSGLHLYYVFNTPIDLFPNVKDQFRELKHELTFRIWDWRETTKEKNIQYQGINQGFRMVGSINEKYGLSIKAFKTGSKIDLDYLNSYIHKEEKRVNLEDRFFSEHTLEEAKMKFPEWYQKVIVEGNKKRKYWIVNRALYDWWKKKIPEVSGGHRYYFLMVLVIYAVKCDIPKKEVKKDLYELFEEVKNIEHSHELTEYDIESALDVYDPSYHNFPIDVIVEKTGIKIEKNRRNFRPQELHLKGARAIQDINDPEGKWRNKKGQPSKKPLIRDYIERNPKANPTQIARELGISRTTVYKYLSRILEEKLYDEEPLIDVKGNKFNQLKIKENN